MPAQDSCQPQVVHALQKEGWAIVDTSTVLYATPDMPIFIDLEAFKADVHIYIEVKCFPRANRTQELHIAFGQYVIYREVLARLRPNMSLYLAVPHNNPDLATPTFQAAINNNHVKIILIDLEKERIVGWNE
ncbi:MAG: element excision factor XisH family protein [Aggregatilineales bacterium]